MRNTEPRPRFLSRRRGLMALLMLASIFTALGFWGFHYYQSTRQMIASIEPYNHTDVGIDELYVDGYWAGNSYPRTGGGSGLCCVILPERWRPGLAVTVKWEKDGYLNQWLTRKVEVPFYEKSGSLQVHFMENDIVKVVVFNLWPNQPSHPLYQELYGRKKRERQ